MRFDEDMGFGLVDSRGAMHGAAEAAKINFSGPEFADFSPPLTAQEQKRIKSELGGISFSLEALNQWRDVNVPMDKSLTQRIVDGVFAAAAQQGLKPPLSYKIVPIAYQAKAASGGGTGGGGSPVAGPKVRTFSTLPSPPKAEPDPPAPDPLGAGRGGPQHSINPPSLTNTKTGAKVPVFGDPLAKARAIQAAQVANAIDAATFFDPQTFALYPSVLDQYEKDAKATYDNLMKGIKFAKEQAAYYNGMTDSLNQNLQLAALNAMQAMMGKDQVLTYLQLRDNQTQIIGNQWPYIAPGASGDRPPAMQLPDHSFAYYGSKDVLDAGKGTRAMGIVMESPGTGSASSRSGLQALYNAPGAPPSKIPSYVVETFQNSVFYRVWTQGGNKVSFVGKDGDRDPYPDWKEWINFPLQLPNRQIKHEGAETVSPSVVGILGHIPEVTRAVACAIAALFKLSVIPQGKVFPTDKYFDWGYSMGFDNCISVPGGGVQSQITKANNASDSYNFGIRPATWDFLLCTIYSEGQAQDICKHPGSVADAVQDVKDGKATQVNVPQPVYIFPDAKWAGDKAGKSTPCGFPQEFVDFVVAATQFFVNEFNKSKTWENMAHSQDAAAAYKESYDYEMNWINAERARIAGINPNAYDVDAEVAKVIASITDATLVEAAKYYATLAKRAKNWKAQSNYDAAKLLPVGPLPEGGVLAPDNVTKANLAELEALRKVVETTQNAADKVHALDQFKIKMQDFLKIGADFMRNATANDLAVAQGWMEDPDAADFEAKIDFPYFPKDLTKAGFTDFGNELRTRLDTAGIGPDVPALTTRAKLYDELQTRFDALRKWIGKAIDQPSVFDDSKNVPPPSGNGNQPPPEQNDVVVKKDTTTAPAAAEGPNLLLIAAAVGAAVLGAPVAVPIGIGALALLGGKKDTQG